MTSGIKSTPFVIDCTATDGGISSDKFEAYLGPVYWQPEGNRRLCICTILFSPSLRLQELATLLMGVAHFLKYGQCAPTYKQLRQRLIIEAQNTTDQVRLDRIKNIAGKLVRCTGTDKELNTEIFAKQLQITVQTQPPIVQSVQNDELSERLQENPRTTKPSNVNENSQNTIPKTQVKKAIRFEKKEKPNAPRPLLRFDVNGVPLPPGPPPVPTNIPVIETPKVENKVNSVPTMSIADALKNRSQLKKVESNVKLETEKKVENTSKPSGGLSQEDIQRQKEKNSQVDVKEIQSQIDTLTNRVNELRRKHDELKDATHKWPEKQAKERADEKLALESTYAELKEKNGEKKPTGKMIQLDSKIKNFDNTSPTAYKKELGLEMGKLEKSIQDLQKQLVPN